MASAPSTYFIAEIGQNHNGDMNLARQLIDAAAAADHDPISGEKFKGINAVKFTKRDLDEELTLEAARKPYNSPNSFGKTYMEHRQALELDYEQHAELEAYARSKGMDFIETICSPGAMKLLDYVTVDAIKIASRDVTNIPLLEAIAERGERVIVSTGMCDLEELQRAVEILKKVPKRIDILHCLSEYPAQFKNLNMRAIHFLQKKFPDHVIGYSDHTVGILIAPTAVAMGAKVIEKHITLDRNMKGSDHAGSLSPNGLWRVLRDIRHVEDSLGVEEKEVHDAVLSTRTKLARSLALRIPMKKGEELTRKHLIMLSPGNGLQWDDVVEVLGKKANRDLEAKVHIRADDFS